MLPDVFPNVPACVLIRNGTLLCCNVVSGIRLWQSNCMLLLSFRKRNNLWQVSFHNILFILSTSLKRNSTILLHVKYHGHVFGRHSEWLCFRGDVERKYVPLYNNKYHHHHHIIIIGTALGLATTGRTHNAKSLSWENTKPKQPKKCYICHSIFSVYICLLGRLTLIVSSPKAKVNF